MLKRLRIKFVCINMMIVLVMLCVIFGLLYHSTRNNLETESRNKLEQLAENPFDPSIVGDEFSQMPQLYFAVQYNMWGEITAIGGYYDLSDMSFLSQVVSAANESTEKLGVLRQYQLRFYRTQQGQYEYLIFADISGEITTLQNLIHTCVLIGIISFLAFLAISILLARWAVHPVEQAWQQQRQFVADASHELKTPLTVILTNAELLQNPEYDATSRSKFCDGILIMAQQMRTLVEQLLELAKADRTQRATVLTQVDLTQLVNRSLLTFEALFFEKELELQDSIASGMYVNGDAAALEHAIEILLDNAQKYASHGVVQVSLQPQGHNRCLLSIANPGPALSPTQLQDIFKRFYRVDSARNDRSSFGLGLSIAAQIVQSHQGRIWAESNAGYNTFYISLHRVHSHSVPCISNNNMLL